MMNWTLLNSEAQLQTLIANSATKPQLIFKHSTRCSISSMAKSRLERKQQPPNIEFYYLDLIAYRALSESVASIFKVEHESPQVLLIKNGQCVYNDSHTGITMDEIVERSEFA